MRFIIGSVFTLLIIGSAAAQESVPSAVSENFQSAFPNATDVEWEREDNNLYEVEFDINGMENEITFDAQGNIVEQEAEVAEADIPAEVRNTLDTQFQGRTIDHIEKEEKNGQVVYYIELEDGLFDDKVKITSDGQVAK